MKLLDDINIKLRSLSEHYFFQKFGLRRVKEDKISKSLLKKYLPVNPVIVDCGAYDGADSVELFQILGGTIHSFEPVDEVYQRLIKRTTKLENIHCYKLALSDKNGFQSFFISEGNSDASSSLLEPQEHLKDHPDIYFKRKQEVQTITLDQWAIENDVKKIDLMWLDMQGHEMNMLQASKEMFRTVSLIHTEVSIKNTYKGVALYEDYKAFLEAHGFSVVLEAIPPGWDMGNVLFARR